MVTCDCRTKDAVPKGAAPPAGAPKDAASVDDAAPVRTGRDAARRVSSHEDAIHRGHGYPGAFPPACRYWDVARSAPARMGVIRTVFFQKQTVYRERHHEESGPVEVSRTARESGGFPFQASDQGDGEAAVWGRMDAVQAESPPRHRARIRPPRPSGLPNSPSGPEGLRLPETRIDTFQFPPFSGDTLKRATHVLK